MNGIKIDWCRHAGISGCIEMMYPMSKWQIVGCMSTRLEPDEHLQETVSKKGATVIAYGGDWAWFALKPHEAVK